MRIEVVVDVKPILGEGPLWDVDQQRLYFIDSFGCNIFRCTADGREIRAWDVPAKIGSIALRKDGKGPSARCKVAFMPSTSRAVNALRSTIPSPTSRRRA